MDDGEFGITNEELYSIMSSESVERIKQFDGKSGIAKFLKSDLKRGISPTDNLTLRRVLYGVNRYPEAPSTSWIELFLDAFGDLAVIILSIAAVVALVAGIVEEALHLSEGGWIEGVAIIFAVLIVASVGATNDVLKDKQFQKLRQTADDAVELTVIRGGEPLKIPVIDLCVGDILELHGGAQIPADGIFLQTIDPVVMCDVSSFNGESALRKISKANPFLISGTTLHTGECRMLVLAVGARCGYGRLCAALIKDKDEDQTPLQAKLEDMVVLIGWVGLGFAVATFLVLMGYYIDENTTHLRQLVDCDHNITVFYQKVQQLNASSSEGYAFLCPNNKTNSVLHPFPKFSPDSLVDLLRAFIVGVTIIVVAVPEGLPLAVTVSLAYSVKIMLKDNNLVRHLEACETMGGVTNICSDKTGTLTQNKMSVVEGFLGGVPFTDVKEITTSSDGLNLGNDKLSAQVKKFVVGAVLLNLEHADVKREGGKLKFEGSATECGLIMFSQYLLGEEEAWRHVIKSAHRVKKWGFSSSKKRMSSIIQDDPGFTLFCKGASEMVLKLCKYKLDREGEASKITKEDRKQLQEVINGMAEKEMRVLGLAFKYFKNSQDWDSSDDGVEFETDLTLIGLVGLMDPLRPEVPDAVRNCKRAGIIVRMVTGDFKLTARAIASKCGILTDGIVLEGPEFRRMKDEDAKDLLEKNSSKKLQVLARSSPEDKQRLVCLLMELDEVVAVTGDGTNDAPALRQAHVGLAMNTGTDVAKLAADIVIIDDNFASIVNAVKWGRCVFDNIRKFLQFQLAVNMVALCIAFIGAITRAGTPLTAVQLLWVNLIMDTMAALALGTERPTPSLLHRKPYGKRGKLITPLMWRNIFGHAIYQVTWLCLILYAVDVETGMHMWLPGVTATWVPGKLEAIIRDPTLHYTMIFNVFVFCQVFNEINCRKVNTELNVFDGFFTNKIFGIILLITCVVQALIVEFGGFAVMTSPLPASLWGITIAISAGELLWGFLLRLIPVPLEEWEKLTSEIA